MMQDGDAVEAALVGAVLVGIRGGSSAMGRMPRSWRTSMSQAGGLVQVVIVVQVRPAK
ncbi:hypothetical protein [Streptomyces stelliscabiei]|uniref:hypothetical protein n=1 Tax=Streptomyces stelliscabiei TaxID=146820 RepID=UPI003EBC7739